MAIQVPYHIALEYKGNNNKKIVVVILLVCNHNSDTPLQVLFLEVFIIGLTMMQLPMMIISMLIADAQIIIRECGAPYLFLHALLHPSIRWRTHEFRLQWGGRAEPVVGVVKKEKEVFTNNQEVHAIKLAAGISENSELAELASSRLIS